MRSLRGTLVLATLLTTGALLAGCQSTAAPEPTGPATPANTVDHAIVLGDGDVDVQLWTDASCPYCAALDGQTGELLTELVESGEITWSIHPMTYVSAKHDDATAYSTRAANLLAAVADAGELDRVPAVYALLLTNQPGGGRAPDDAALLRFAADAGVEADLTDAVQSQRFATWAEEANERWLGAALPGTGRNLEYVPTLVIDGTFLELQGDATDADTVREALQAAVSG